jgi:CheY-like chemotaxis protein
MAATERPDLILLDLTLPVVDGLTLPVVDGWEATKRLKAQPETRGIPVIALSAHPMAGDREKALAAGRDEFETKPVEMPRLLAKMQALLPKRDAP